MKTTIYLSIRTLRQLFSLIKNFCFRSNLDLEQFFWPNVEISWRSCENWILRVHRSILMEKIFWFKNFTFQYFWDLEKLSFRLCRKLSGRFLTFSFYVSKGTFLGKKLFSENISQPSKTTIKKLSDFLKYFSPGMSKLPSRCP